MDVIITTDPEKLPAEIRALQDLAQPLPAAALFFEERFSFLGLAKNATMAAILAGLALITFAFFIAMLVESFGPTTVAASQYQSQALFGTLAVGGVFGFGCYIMLASLIPATGLAWSGQHTRYGVTLLDGRLVIHSLFDTTVIPRDRLVSIDGRKLSYLLGEATKSLSLPDIVGGRGPQLEAAIQTWKAAA